MKYNLKTMAISVAGLVLLFCILSYLIAPDNECFLSSINPLGFLEGIIFALGFGLGVPVWLSLIVVGLFSFLLFMVFLWVTRKITR